MSFEKNTSLVFLQQAVILSYCADSADLLFHFELFICGLK